MAHRLSHGLLVRSALGVGALLGGGVLCGGCPDVRNGLVDAAERAAVIAATQEFGNDPVEVLGSGIATTFLDVLFENLRKPQP